MKPSSNDPRVHPDFRYTITFEGRETLQWRAPEGALHAEEEGVPGSPLRGVRVLAITKDPLDASIERWVVENPREPEAGQAVVFVGPGRTSASRLYIDRGNAQAQTGWIRWPTDRAHEEMGASVVAIFRSHPLDLDPFVRCLDAVNVAVTLGDPVLPKEHLDSLWPRHEDDSFDPVARGLSDELLAAVTLGTCGRSFEGWQPGYSDLTPEGYTLIRMLERLYERQAEFVLFVDT